MTYLKPFGRTLALAAFLCALAAPYSALAYITSTLSSSQTANVPRCTTNAQCPSGGGPRVCSTYHFSDGVDGKLCTFCNLQGAAQCSSGTTCNQESGICVANQTATPANSSPASGAGETAAQGGAATQSREFIPLTSIPGIQNASSASTLPAFLNSLYRICIGLAAAIAVLQITRAGIIYMLQDTGITEKKQARHILEMSVFGLVLVLSPAIVFGVIDPRILNLDISIANLHLNEAPAFTIGGGNGSGTGGNAATCAAAAPEVQNVQVGNRVEWNSTDSHNDANIACCSSKSVCSVANTQGRSVCDCVQIWEVTQIKVFIAEATGTGSDNCFFTDPRGGSLPVYNSVDQCLSAVAVPEAGHALDRSAAAAVESFVRRFNFQGNLRIPPSCVDWLHNLSVGTGAGTNSGNYVRSVQVQCKQRVGVDYVGGQTRLFQR